MTLLLVMVGAAVGAPLRYLTDRAVRSRHGTEFPWGTLTVNVVASLVLGLLTGAVLAGAASHNLHALLGTGFCGALSTYSTFSYESMRLVEQCAFRRALANVTLSVVGAVGGAFVGAGIAHVLWR